MKSCPNRYFKTNLSQLCCRFVITLGNFQNDGQFALA